MLSTSALWVEPTDFAPEGLPARFSTPSGEPPLTFYRVLPF